jgi:hypothetical protein
VNYKDFNKITIKNRHSFFLIRKTLNRFNGTAIYTKLDFKNIYYKIRIKERDEWKKIFRIRYSYFEYKIILFNFINVPAIFQIYINKILADLIDINYITYFDNIFIYFYLFMLNISNISDKYWNGCANINYILNYLNANSLSY